MTDPTIAERIADYLGNGGLWNPEAMEHDKVRALLIDCRDYLQSIESQPVPVEPRRSDQCGIHYAHQPHDYCNGTAAPLIPDEELISRGYVTELQSALKLAQEERDTNGNEWARSAEALVITLQRAEKAEAINRRMVELMKRLRTELGYCNMQLKGEGYTPSPDLRAAINDADELLKEATK